jgi:hypothetical protein
MTLPRFVDATGRPVPRGSSIRDLVYPALTLPLPDWMPASSQSGSQTLSGGVLHVSGSSGTLGLRTLPVDLNVHEVVAFTTGFRADSSAGINVGISLKDDPGSLGVSIFQTSTGQPTAMLRLLGSGAADVAIEYILAGIDLTRRRDLTIAIGQSDKSVWLLQDDQVVHHNVYPQLRLGVVRGVLDAAISTTRELQVSKVSLRTETM